MSIYNGSNRVKQIKIYDTGEKTVDFIIDNNVMLYYKDESYTFTVDAYLPNAAIGDNNIKTAIENYRKETNNNNTVYIINKVNSKFGGETLTIPEKWYTPTYGFGPVVGIDSNACDNLTGLHTVKIHSNIYYLGSNIFKNNPDNLIIDYGGTVANWCSIINTGAMNNITTAYKLYINGSDITSVSVNCNIGNNSFINLESITSVDLEDSVTSVGVNAFYGCTNITNVDLGTSLTNESVGTNAFSGCANIATIKGLASACATVATQCDNANGYDITVKTDATIPKETFATCYYIKSISLPFVGTSKLSKISTSHYTDSTYFAAIFSSSANDNLEGVTYTYNNTTYNYYIPKKLTTVIIRGGDIAKSAFENCNILTKIEITGNTTKTIGTGAFHSCINITSFTMPSSVKTIGDNPFRWCIKLTASNFTITGLYGDYPSFAISDRCLICYTSSSNMQIISGFMFAEDNTYSTTPAKIPTGKNGITSIDICQYAFCQNTKLPTVLDLLSYKITQIQNYAFYQCGNLTKVTIPNTVTRIGSCAFGLCYSLQEIILPFIGQNATATSASASTLLNYIFYTGGVKPTYGGDNYNKITQSYGNTNADKTAYVPKSLKKVTVNGGKMLYGGFSNFTQLTNITLNNITNIGQEAFKNCSGITSFTIPSTVTSIGVEAFKNCSGITTLTVPSTVTSIGVRAFCGCYGLTSIVLPFVGGTSNPSSASAATLFGYVFDYDMPANDNNVQNDQYFSWTNEDSKNATITRIPKSLKTVTINGGKLLYGAFFNCKTLTSVTLGSDISSIGDAIFKYCDNMTTCQMDENMPATSIGSAAFYGCSALTSIVIPKKITQIKTYVFANCSALTSVIFKTTGLITLGDSSTNDGYVFEGCSNLTSLSIPETVTHIGYKTLNNCVKLASLTLPANGLANKKTTASQKTLFGYIFGTDGYSTGGYTATQRYSSTSTYSCKFPTSLTKLTINGQGKIFYGAFTACSKLTEITIGTGITEIEYGVFGGCTSLVNLTIPFIGISRKTDNDTYQYPFGRMFGSKYTSNATQTTQIYYGSSLSSTTSTTYYIPNSLKSVTVSEGNILRGAFYNCSGLTSITLPNAITYISAYAFYNCSGLPSITLPNAITFIGSNAFYNCNSLTLIRIPNSATTIGTYAFHRCSNIKFILMPNTITSIGNYAFADCTTLNYVKLPKNLSTINEGVFYNCTRMRMIAIGNALTTISSNAFENCKNLSITKKGTFTINSSAFTNCENITLFVDFTSGLSQAGAKSMAVFYGSTLGDASSTNSGYSYVSKVNFSKLIFYPSSVNNTISIQNPYGLDLSNSGAYDHWSNMLNYENNSMQIRYNNNTTGESSVSWKFLGATNKINDSFVP